MKSTTLLLTILPSLGLAAPVFPLPVFDVDGIDADPRPATPATTLAPPSVIGSIPASSRADDRLLADDDDDLEEDDLLEEVGDGRGSSGALRRLLRLRLARAPIDNSPLSPSPAAPPAVVLASPRPVQSTYLLALAGMAGPSSSSSRTGGGGGGGGTGGKEGVAPQGFSSSSVPVVVISSSSTSSTSSSSPAGKGVGEAASEAAVLAAAVMELEISRGQRRPAVPVVEGAAAVPGCYRAHMSRGPSRDVLVVGLAMTFLLVIVAVEAWGVVCSSATPKTWWKRRGAIRLEEDETRTNSGRLSVGAGDDLPEVVTGKEEGSL